MAKCMHDECSCEAGREDAPYCSEHCRAGAQKAQQPSRSATAQDMGSGCGCGHTECG
jgi:hypothetical protein